MPMNMNSAHQLWSKWTFTVTPGRAARPFEEVRTNCARFGRKAFGAASEMRVTKGALTSWVVDVRTEGHPVHDLRYVEWMTAQWRRFFVNGFGVGTVVVCATKLEAGDRQDGRPSDQLIIVPPIAVQGGLS